MKFLPIFFMVFVATLKVKVKQAVASLKKEVNKAIEHAENIRFIRDMRAAAPSSSVVGILVSLLVSLLICIIVVQALIGSQTQAGWSATANTTWTSLQTNIWVAITLLVIVPIIVGATIILSYIRRGM